MRKKTAKQTGKAIQIAQRDILKIIKRLSYIKEYNSIGYF